MSSGQLLHPPLRLLHTLEVCILFRPLMLEFILRYLSAAPPLRRRLLCGQQHPEAPAHAPLPPASLLLPHTCTAPWCTASHSPSPLPSPTQDSGAYFLHMLWNLYSLPGYGREALLAEATVYEAASLLVDVWATELHHEQRSTYRYSELAREGRGPPSNYTGGWDTVLKLHMVAPGFGT